MRRGAALFAKLFMTFITAFACEGCALFAGLEERTVAAAELAKDQALPNALAVDDGFVYWTNEGQEVADRSVQRVPKAGGATVVLALTGSFTPRAIAVDSEDVYWTQTIDLLPMNVCPMGEGDRLARMSKGASDGVEEVMLPCTKSERMGIAQDSAHVYFTRFGDNVVSRMDKATSEVTNVAGGQENPLGVAVDSKAVYWASNDVDQPTHDEVRRRSKDGGEVEILALTPGNPTWLVIDDASIYWVTDGGDVFKLGKEAVAPAMPETLASGFDTPGGIAVDSLYVYITDSALGTVVKIRKDGSGEPVVIASDQSYPAAITVDETSVYWTNRNGGQVMRLIKERE